jgi:hypothetical protein
MKSAHCTHDNGIWEPRDRIVNAVAPVDVTSFNKQRDELKYRVDVCRITRGSQTEHL